MLQPHRRPSSRPGLVNERLLALFVLGVIMITPPFIAIFNRASWVGGIPLLYAYLFAGWAILIGLTALVIDYAGDEADEANSGPRRTPDDNSRET